MWTRKLLQETFLATTLSTPLPAFFRGVDQLALPSGQIDVGIVSAQGLFSCMLTGHGHVHSVRPMDKYSKKEHIHGHSSLPVTSLTLTG